MMVVCLSMQMSGVVQSTGTLEMKINNFRNPTEHLRDGSCCDTFCIGQCDDIFHFGLDQSTGSTNDPKSNYYFTKVTGTYQDQNDVDFSDNMNGGVNNPIIWNFDSWPGSVLFKVYIEDDDQPYSGNDNLDGMVERLTLVPSQSKSSASVTTITIYGQRDKDKTSLSMTYKCYCDDNYYGPTCSVNCVERDSNEYGHYTCDPYTGAKICRPGWEDVSKDCKTFADDCVGNGCLNGAKCVDGIRSYTCACIGGYTGSSCETNINECASGPCLNEGTCSDLINAFTCSCTTDYVGPRCAEIACVASNPCLHGGTCYDDRKCFCTDGYTGSSCEMTKCQAVPCMNGGTCSANGTCICPTQFIGTQCELMLCSLIDLHCMNGGSCVNGACSCKDQFWGVNCERESCTSNTCLNGGICSNTNNTVGYECMCPESFTGPRCQSYVAMQPPCNQPIKSSDTDVSIFRGDGGILLIILIIVCIILFLIIVAFIAFLVYRRRRKRCCSEKRRAASTMSTTTIISAIDIGSTSSSSSTAPPSANIYTDSDDVFVAVAAGKSSEKPWKTKEIKGFKGGYGEENKGVEGIENHYERIDGGAGGAGGEGRGYVEADVEHGYVHQDSTDAPDLPERYSCDIKDIHGDTICMSTKLADC
jgi:hypothetical protein